MQPTKQAVPRRPLPCKYWAQGHCFKGSQCDFAHDPQVQRPGSGVARRPGAPPPPPPLPPPGLGSYSGRLAARGPPPTSAAAAASSKPSSSRAGGPGSAAEPAAPVHTPNQSPGPTAQLSITIPNSGPFARRDEAQRDRAAAAPRSSSGGNIGSGARPSSAAREGPSGSAAAPAAAAAALFRDQRPAPGPQGYQHPLYKTALCIHWMADRRCYNGRECRFAHGHSELREDPRRPAATLPRQQAPSRPAPSAQAVPPDAHLPGAPSSPLDLPLLVESLHQQGGPGSPMTWQDLERHAQQAQQAQQQQLGMVMGAPAPPEMQQLQQQQRWAQQGPAAGPGLGSGQRMAAKGTSGGGGSSGTGAGPSAAGAASCSAGPSAQAEGPSSPTSYKKAAQAAAGWAAAGAGGSGSGGGSGSSSGAAVGAGFQQGRLGLFSEPLRNRFPAFVCPISLDLFVDPVVAADGHTYERANIEDWLYNEKKNSSPCTGQDLPHKVLVPNTTLKKAMDEVRDFMAGLSKLMGTV